MKLNSIALLALPVCLLAQSAAPPAAPEQEQAIVAIKERATQFYRLLVAGKPRASEEFVCEASKDAYYAAPKSKPISAEVTAVKFLPDGQTARVVALLEDEYPLPMGTRKKIQKMPTPSLWKQENGQWCYFIEPAPERKAGEPAKAPGTDLAAVPRPKLGEPPPGVKVEDLPKLANEVSASKREFRIPADADGQDEIIVTNGLNGPVKLQCLCRKTPGLECKADKLFIGHGQQAKLSVQYKFSGAKLPQGIRVVLWIEPFHTAMSFPIVTEEKK